MAKSKIELDETIVRQIFPFQASKAQRRMLQIAEAAIRCYSTIGYNQTTFDRIAEECEISRPLIKHYFDTREEIFEFSIRYIRANLQHLAVEAIGRAKTSTERIENYVGCTFDWIKKYRSHAKVWVYYIYWCTFDDEVKKKNTEVVNIGHDRISAMLEQGKSDGEFDFQDARGLAKQIQSLILGALMTTISEELYTDLKTFKSDTIQSALVLCGASFSSDSTAK